MRQPVDRDHENVVLYALDAPRPDETQDGKSAASCPSSPAPGQPQRLLTHPCELAPVVASGFRLDGYSDPGRCDRHRVDVSTAPPRERVAQPPALRLQW